MDKGIHIHPLIARGDRRCDGRSFWGPDPPQNGFEADTMLIHAPQFNARFPMSGSHVLDLLGQFFYKPAELPGLLWHAGDEARANYSPLAAGNPTRVEG